MTSLVPKALHRCISEHRALAAPCIWQLKGTEKLGGDRIKWQITSSEALRAGWVVLWGCAQQKFCMQAALLETREQQLSRALESGQLGADLQGRELLKIENDLRSLRSHPRGKSLAVCSVPVQHPAAGSSSACLQLVQGILQAKLWEAAGSELERLWMRLLEAHQTGAGVIQLFAASHSKVTCEGQRIGSEAPQSSSPKSSPLPTKSL